jgi:hypothetical protein
MLFEVLLGEFLNPLNVSHYQVAKEIGVPARRTGLGRSLMRYICLSAAS